MLRFDAKRGSKSSGLATGPSPGETVLWFVHRQKRTAVCSGYSDKSTSEFEKKFYLTLFIIYSYNYIYVFLLLCVTASVV